MGTPATWIIIHGIIRTQSRCLGYTGIPIKNAILMGNSMIKHQFWLNLELEFWLKNRIRIIPTIRIYIPTGYLTYPWKITMLLIGKPSISMAYLYR